MRPGRARLLIVSVAVIVVLALYALFLATYNLWGPSRVPPTPG